VRKLPPFKPCTAIILKYILVELERDRVWVERGRGVEEDKLKP
jgi:hypothetical protein